MQGPAFPKEDCMRSRISPNPNDAPKPSVPDCPDCRKPRRPAPYPGCSLNEPLWMVIPPGGAHLSCPVHPEGHHIFGSQITW